MLAHLKRLTVFSTGQVFVGLLSKQSMPLSEESLRSEHRQPSLVILASLCHTLGTSLPLYFVISVPPSIFEQSLFVIFWGLLFHCIFSFLFHLQVIFVNNPISGLFILLGLVVADLPTGVNTYIISVYSTTQP